jgi:hypothetical protein
MRLLELLHRVLVASILALACTSSSFAQGQQPLEQVIPLSPEAIVQRCYGQMVRKRMPKGHELLQRVISGQTLPVDACMEILQKGLLQDKGSGLFELADPEDDEARSVLKTFHDFHRGWLEEAEFPDQIYTRIFMRVDREEPIGYFTHALLGPNVPYTSVVQGNQALRIVRDERYTYVRADSTADINHSVRLQQGIIKGVEFYPVGHHTWWEKIEKDFSGGVEYDQPRHQYSPYTFFTAPRTHGPAGILGLDSFIWGHNGFPVRGNRADGAERVMRRLARDILDGLLCRKIPLLRTADVTGLVSEYLTLNPNPEDQIPFRTNSLCMSCHSGMDPMAGAYRNVLFAPTLIFDGEEEVGGDTHMYLAGGLQTNADEIAGFHLISKDANYYRRPPNFKLHYRSYNGELVDEHYTASNLTDALTQMGNALAQKDDFYMCAASRYFKFFTGIEVNLLDIEDPRNGAEISDGDLHYRQVVEQLAMALKNDPNKNLQSLIRAIFASNLYRTEGMRDLKPEQ